MFKSILLCDAAFQPATLNFEYPWPEQWFGALHFQDQADRGLSRARAADDCMSADLGMAARAVQAILTSTA